MAIRSARPWPDDRCGADCERENDLDTRVNGAARLFAHGVCYDCIVRIDGRIERACMKPVEEGMQISLPERFGEPTT